MKQALSILFILIGIIIPVWGKQDFILGSEEGEGQLIFPIQVEEGPDGLIYAYDMADAFIKVYSPQGKFLRKIGGKGQGPGEIQRADDLSFGFTHDGKLFFTEFFGGHPWITVMEPSGEFNKVIKPSIKRYFGINSAFSLEDGGFITQISLMGTPERKKDYFLYNSPMELVFIDSKGQIKSTIKKTEYLTRISFHEDGADSPIPFTPMFAWCPHKNRTILFSDGLSTKFMVLDLNGKLVEEMATSLPEPEKVTKKDLDEWRKRRKESARDPSWYNRYGRVVEKYKKSIYEKKPNLTGISTTPDGNILASGPVNYQESKMDFWLLDESGRNLARISAGMSRLILTPHFLFYLTRDEEGNIILQCFFRQSTEKDDLLRLHDLLQNSEGG